MTSAANLRWLRSARFHVAGRALFYLGLAGLAIIELGSHGMLPSLAAHEAPEFLGKAAALAIAVGIVAQLARATGNWLRLLLPGAFSILFVASVWSIAHQPTRADIWVGAVEAGSIAATAGWLAGVIQRKHLLIVVGVMIACFGVVHLVERELIVSLIPAWFPFGAVWPWVTGPVMIVAGLLMVARRYAEPVSLLVGAMFLTWLPLVHLGRIITSPWSTFEWSFALTATALVGVCWLVASAPADDQASGS